MKALLETIALVLLAMAIAGVVVLLLVAIGCNKIVKALLETIALVLLAVAIAGVVVLLLVAIGCNKIEVG